MSERRSGHCGEDCLACLVGVGRHRERSAARRIEVEGDGAPDRWDLALAKNPRPDTASCAACRRDGEVCPSHSGAVWAWESWYARLALDRLLAAGWSWDGIRRLLFARWAYLEEKLRS